MKVVHSEYRPSPRTLVLVLAAMALIVGLGVVTNQYLLASFVTMFICGSVIAWWVLQRKGLG